MFAIIDIMDTSSIQLRQLTNTAVMIRPDHFGFNPQTAETNVFQTNLEAQGMDAQEVQKKAEFEFDHMVARLQDKGLRILVIPSKKDIVTPDAVFPNNWFSHHQTESSAGKLVVYPMLTPNRRAERQPEILLQNLEAIGIQKPEILDVTAWENEDKMLEGTGSMVLDRAHKVAFAMESPRTTQDAFYEWCHMMEYEPVFFHAYDQKSLPVYHTNVVMSVGREFAVTCPESIPDEQERENLIGRLHTIHKDVISITLEQVYTFCANILQMESQRGESKIVLSQTAFDAFTSSQKNVLEKYGELVPVAIPTIERVGGGSARCMIAEVFPPSLNISIDTVTKNVR